MSTTPVKSEEPPMNSLTPTPSTPAPPASSYTWAIDPALQAQAATPAQNTTTTTTTPATTPAPTPAPTTYQYAQPAQPSGTYQYGYYPGYYGYHPQQPGAAATSTVTPPTAATNTNTNTNTNANTNTNNNQVDSSDIATLNDALGSAGVDLRAEEESLQTSSFRSNTYLSAQHGDRTRKQPPTPAFNTTFIAGTMKSIGAQHKITRIPDDSVNYLSLALRARLGDLINNMIKASSHRTSTQFDRPATMYPTPSIDTTKGGVVVSSSPSSEMPVSEAAMSTLTDPIPMWSILIRSDVAKQLSAIEKVEREEELRVRRERKERAELAASHAAALAAASAGGASAGGASAGGAGGTGAGGVGGDGDEDGQPKKKRKKEGPGVTARNMSEDVRKKMSNAVASQAAGLGGRYAWMTAANANAPPPPKKAQPAAPATSSASGVPLASTPATVAKPYTATTTSTVEKEKDARMKITMRDAMFVISTERGHGGGRGAARGWT